MALRTYGNLADTFFLWNYLKGGIIFCTLYHKALCTLSILMYRQQEKKIGRWIIFFIVALVLCGVTAFVAGSIRGIPIYWRLIDCSFGIVGLVPLSVSYRAIVALEKERRTDGIGW